MKNSLTAIATGIAMSAMSMNASADKGWQVLAGLEDGYTPEPSIALITGPMDFESDDGNVTGVEVSFNCPLLQPPTNKIREQLSFTNYSKAYGEIYNIELNPHYVVEVSPSLWVGAGPGLGLVISNPEIGDTSTRFGVGLGGSVHYEGLGPLFLGMEARYQLTNKKDGSDANNSRILLKVGYNFMR